jgi:16S rRNA A1518/A1519 N6-dimethyltransferase RsmA/KsgA/DIM1 with predicted DNA glycosylase/AP lyase activity
VANNFYREMKLPPVKELLSRFNIKPKKQFSQNFLTSPLICNTFTKPLIEPSTLYIEIGIGPGGLARSLLARGLPVYGVEKDARFTPILDLLVDSYPTFQYTIADALDPLLLDHIPQKHNRLCIYGNLPFSIGGKLLSQYTLLHLSRKLPAITVLAFMFTKQVAEKLLYINCKRSKFSVLVSTAFNVEFVNLFPRDVFRPMPSEDCIQLKFTPKEHVLEKEDVDKFIEFMDVVYKTPNRDISPILETVGYKGAQVGGKVHQVSSSELLSIFKSLNATC